MGLRAVAWAMASASVLSAGAQVPGFWWPIRNIRRLADNRHLQGADPVLGLSLVPEKKNGFPKVTPADDICARHITAEPQGDGVLKRKRFPSADSMRCNRLIPGSADHNMSGTAHQTIPLLSNWRGGGGSFWGCLRTGQATHPPKLTHPPTHPDPPLLPQ